ncbi:MAG: hypothetical protein EOO05_04215 [Chitinophagaceae bacterium]|nr:MAG: hypothetical protein EOO05_04215 [Chitinophagaceae bacterium]
MHRYARQKTTVMQWSILWQGRQRDSREHCLVHTNESGIKVDSVIIGKQEDLIYRVEYSLLLDHNWRTISFSVSSIHNKVIQRMEYSSDGEGNWMDGDKPVPRLQGCLDIDLPLTPFTNSLPIKRLKQQVGQESDVRVIYIDLLAEKISPVTQKYKRLGEDEYHYQNVPNDFEVTMRTDHEGFVVDYPGLFLQSGCTRLD